VSDWSSEADPGPTTLPHPLGGLATTLRALLLLSAVLSAGLAFLAVRMRAALDDVDPDERLAGASARSAVDAFVNGTSIFFLSLATIGVLFVIWMWRAAKNNQAFGRPGALGPGWAIGGWFIPLGSLAIPAVQLQQLWRGADASVPRGDPGWRRSAGSVQLWVWWVAYVVGQILTLFGIRSILPTEETESRRLVIDLLDRLSEVRLGVTLFVAGQGLLIAAAALGAALVISLTRRQEAAATALGPALPGAVPRGWGRPASPAAWHPDPTGRYDQRYWDGALWTEHVVRDGEQSTDPV
jgi:hypothetical protein